MKIDILHNIGIYRNETVQKAAYIFEYLLTKRKVRI
jgi:hypothetical protein